MERNNQDMENALFHSDIVESNRIIYTPSDFAKINLYHLQEIGELHAQQQHISKRADLNSHLFFIVKSGSGVITYEDQIHPIHAGDCVFLDCRKPYAHETSADLWSLQWLHFSGPNIINIYAKYRERGGQPCFRPQSPERFESIWKMLYDISRSDDYIRDMRLNEGLTHLMTLLMDESWHPETSAAGTKRQNLQEIKAYLDTHYAEKITLDDLAEQFYINKFYLSRIFKAQYDISINTYLLHLRITKAKQLLRFSNNSLENIGLQCGMGPLNYFSRTFKKVEGINPSEYRKKW